MIDQYSIKFTIVGCADEVITIDQDDTIFLSTGSTLLRFFHYDGTINDKKLFWTDEAASGQYYDVVGGACGDLIW